MLESVDINELMEEFQTVSLDLVSRMTQLPIEPGKINLKEDCHPTRDYSVVITITGEFTGAVAMSLNEATALCLVSAMMDNKPVENLDDMAKSALCELANMTIGQALSGLAERSSLFISSPSLVARSDFPESHENTGGCYLVSLETSEGIIEFTINLRENANTENSEKTSKKNILIVDDTQFMRHMLREIFEKNGYRVAGEAVNGKEAVEMFEELSPDLITMDISMPEMDGIEALKKIMAINPAAQVIMVSAMGYKDKILTAVKEGAKEFIVKPFDPDTVLQATKAVLKN